MAGPICRFSDFYPARVPLCSTGTRRLGSPAAFSRGAFFLCVGRWIVTSPSVLCWRNCVADGADDEFCFAHPRRRAEDRGCCYPPRGRSRQLAIRFSGKRDAEKGGGCKGKIKRSWFASAFARTSDGNRRRASIFVSVSTFDPGGAQAIERAESYTCS